MVTMFIVIFGLFKPVLRRLSLPCVILCVLTFKLDWTTVSSRARCSDIRVVAYFK